jgi:catechol 2,3-dioxygenase-like lactoylglutathione lyase family enzyme
MGLPATNFDPPFRITRASHVVLTVRDLMASRLLYEKVIGLILTAEEDEALYFRGVQGGLPSQPGPAQGKRRRLRAAGPARVHG